MSRANMNTLAWFRGQVRRTRQIQSWGSIHHRPTGVERVIRWGIATKIRTISTP